MPTTSRNHLIDIARAASMAIVVTFHSLLYVLVPGPGFVPWAPGPVLWALSWALTIMPVFFVAGGFANAVVVDKWRTRRYADYLAARGGRLVGPIALFIGVFTLVSTAVAWAGFLPQALELSPRFAQLLWFLVVYLCLLAAAPLLVWAHDRFGGWAMLPFIAAAIVVDVVAHTSGQWDIHWLNLAFVWPLAHQWGVAYQRGWFRTWRVRWLAAGVVGSAAVIAVLVFGLGYPPAAVAWWDVRIANLQPPTVAVLVMGFGQTCVLGVLDRLGVGATLGPRAARVVGVANALLLTAYFWHIPLIVAAGGVLAGIAWLFPDATAVAFNQLVWAGLTWVFVVLAIPRIARLEQRITGTSGRSTNTSSWSSVALAVLALGIFGQWQYGAVLHPAAPGACAATVLVVAGLVWFRHYVTEASPS